MEEVRFDDVMYRVAKLVARMAGKWRPRLESRDAILLASRTHDFVCFVTLSEDRELGLEFFFCPVWVDDLLEEVPPAEQLSLPLD